MATDVVMPQMGADMEEGTLLRWLKHPGEHVARGEPIAEIETDKANIEIESFEEGVLTETLADEGQVIPVGQPIARIGVAGEAVASPRGAASLPSTATSGTSATPESPHTTTDQRSESLRPEPAVQDAPIDVASTPAPEAPATTVAAEAPPGHASEPDRPTPGDETPPGERLRVSPVARNLAQTLGVDVSTLHGSGPDGRIMRKDVEAAAQAGTGHLQEASTAPGGWSREVPAAPPAGESAAEPATTEPAPDAGAAPQPVAEPQPEPHQKTATASAVAPASRSAAADVQPLSRMRQAIARRMSQSKREAPHYYVTAEVDMTEAMGFRASLNAAAGDGVHVTVNDLIVKACADVLRRYPAFNASYTDQGLHFHERINVCIAIALPDGLIAPALLDTGDKSLGAIARESHDLGERARNGGLRGPELNDGTFTISNLGMFGIETLIPIIQLPQAAILGVGAVLDKPAVRDGQIVARKLMTVALAADHRVTDGAQGGEFLRELKNTLEHPVALAL